MVLRGIVVLAWWWVVYPDHTPYHKQADELKAASLCFGIYLRGFPSQGSNRVPAMLQSLRWLSAGWGMFWRISKTNWNTLEQRGRDIGSPVLLLLGGVFDAHFQTFLSLAAFSAGPCLLPVVSVFFKTSYGSNIPAVGISGGRAWMEVRGECLLDLFQVRTVCSHLNLY